jgi:hypothetical protein
MVVHIKTEDNGIIKNGRLIGRGEKIITDDLGNGTILKGNFNNGVLNDTLGIKINYTENSFTKKIGNFENGNENGNIQIYTYEDNSPINIGRKTRNR